MFLKYFKDHTQKLLEFCLIFKVKLVISMQNKLQFAQKLYRYFNKELNMNK